MASVFTQENHHESMWLGGVFYAACGLLLLSAFCYGLFLAKAYWYQEGISQLRNRISGEVTAQQHADEKKVLSYQKKIEDVASLLQRRTLMSGIFHLIETNTLSAVSFSSFDLSVPSREMRLTGNAASIEAISLQVQALERHADYIKSITVLDSVAALDGKVTFTLNILLYQKVFEDMRNILSIL